MIYLMISGVLRLASVLRLSEEAGIQRLGSDHEAIWKVRLISISLSSIISLLLFHNTSSFESLFNTLAEPANVS
jgi:hypothetical protein